jgi:hypothetical protein
MGTYNHNSLIHPNDIIKRCSSPVEFLGNTMKVRHTVEDRSLDLSSLRTKGLT